MKADVQSEAEKEAIEWAVKFFRGCAHALKPGGVSRRYEEKLEQIKILLLLRTIGLLDEWLAASVDFARRGQIGDSLASSLDVFGIAAALIEAGEPLPKPLREFMADALREHPKRLRTPGPKSKDYKPRNELIAGAVWFIRTKWQFPITRHRRDIGTGRASAASIVRKALVKGVNLHTIGEPAINKICEKYAGVIENGPLSEKTSDD